MKYAKLENGRFKYAPKKVTHGGKTICNPPPDVLQELGYLPVQNRDMPTDAPGGFHYESSWQQSDDSIIQVWNLVETPVYEEHITDEEAVAIITGKITDTEALNIITGGE